MRGKESVYFKNFQKNVKRILQEKNATQQDLADAIGTSVSNVRNWLNGRHVPKMNMLVAIAIYCDRSIDCLIENDFDKIF